MTDYAVLATQPISDASACGSDPRETTEYLALKQEIEKLSRPEQFDQVDLNVIIDNGKVILTEHCKDLNTACYLGYALIESQGLTGLANSVILLQNLCETYWAELYPALTRLRGRYNIITWWRDAAQAFIARTDFNPQPVDFINTIKEDINTLDQFLNEQDPDAPMLKPLARDIGNIPLVAEAVASSSDVEAASSTSVQTVDFAASISTDEEAQALLVQCMSSLNKIGHYFFQQNNSDPRAYRYNRLSAWYNVQQLPSNQQGTTRVPPPNAQLLQRFERVTTGADPVSILAFCEEALTQSIFWLDLNRFAAQALTELGENYQAAEQVVISATQHFVEFFPGIQGLAFSDGMAFADAETKQWLKEHSTQGHGAQPAVVFEESDKAQQELQQLIDNAKGQHGNDLQKHLGLIQQKLQQLPARRSQLIALTALCELLNRGKRTLPGEAIVEQLLAMLKTYHVTEWEPALALPALLAAYKFWLAQEDDHAKKIAADILQQISLIDLPTALSQS